MDSGIFDESRKLLRLEKTLGVLIEVVRKWHPFRVTFFFAESIRRCWSRKTYVFVVQFFPNNPWIKGRNTCLSLVWIVMQQDLGCHHFQTHMWAGQCFHLLWYFPPLKLVDQLKAMSWRKIFFAASCGHVVKEHKAQIKLQIFSCTRSCVLAIS